MKETLNLKQGRFTDADTRELETAARVAIEESLKLKRNERVLIVANPPKESLHVAQALYNAALDAGGTPILLLQGVKKQLDFADEAVIKSLGTEPDVFISISTGRLGKDRWAIKEPYKLDGRSYDHIFHYLMAAKKLRAFWSPMVTREMFRRTVPVDYERLRLEARALKSVLDAATELRISSPAGTDLRMGIRGREAFVDDGDLSQAGAGGNLPAGETFISPELLSSEGTIVFDASLSFHDGEAIAENPVRVEVKEGF
ncbi:MAG TPA: peptidase M17, partial [Sediminispirochaeta sp.]|nr:peptidase M17 [Sediminispirochaeta sp.]